MFESLSNVLELREALHRSPLDSHALTTSACAHKNNKCIWFRYNNIIQYRKQQMQKYYLIAFGVTQFCVPFERNQTDSCHMGRIEVRNTHDRLAFFKHTIILQLGYFGLCNDRFSIKMPCTSAVRQGGRGEVSVGITFGTTTTWQILSADRWDTIVARYTPSVTAHNYPPCRS